MTEQRPSILFLKRAFGDVLEADGMLLSMIFNGETYNGGVPGTWDWIKPCLEWGIQSAVDDGRNGYGQRGVEVQFRVVVHDRGEQPGMWDFERCYMVLERATSVLEAATITPSDGQKVWRIRYLSDIPEMPVEDSDTGMMHIAVGSIYTIRTYKREV